MSAPTILGVLGETLTFLGGIVLSLDALQRRNEFRKTTDLKTAVAALSGINLTQNGLSIFDNESVELLFIRRSVRRALWGTAIITSGFLCLLAARILELRAAP